MARHSNELFGYLVRFVGNRAVAEDLLGDVLVKMMEQHHTAVDDGFAWRPWLYRVATNQAISHLRKEKIRQWIGLDGLDVADNEFDVRAIALRKQLLQSVPSQREALWAEFDRTMDEWGKQREGREAVQAQYVALCYERPLRMLQLRTQELAARYECMLDEPLNAQLAHHAPDNAQFATLAAERATLVRTMQTEWTTLKTALDTELAAETQTRDALLELHAKETELDAALDQRIDTAVTAFEGYGKRLGALSKQMLALVKPPQKN